MTLSFCYSVPDPLYTFYCLLLGFSCLDRLVEKEQSRMRLLIDGFRTLEPTPATTTTTATTAGATTPKRTIILTRG